jgi:hypothetical protein
MSDALSRSWNLVKASARVLSAEKGLPVFPLLSGVLVALAGIYTAAVYRCAADGATDGAYFEPALVQSAFRS